MEGKKKGKYRPNYKEMSKNRPNKATTGVYTQVQKI